MHPKVSHFFTPNQVPERGNYWTYLRGSKQDQSLQILESLQGPTNFLHSQTRNFRIPIEVLKGAFIKLLPYPKSIFKPFK